MSFVLEKVYRRSVFSRINHTYLGARICFFLAQSSCRSQALKSFCCRQSTKQVDSEKKQRRANTNNCIAKVNRTVNNAPLHRHQLTQCTYSHIPYSNEYNCMQNNRARIRSHVRTSKSVYRRKRERRAKRQRKQQRKRVKKYQKEEEKNNFISTQQQHTTESNNSGTHILCIKKVETRNASIVHVRLSYG